MVTQYIINLINFEGLIENLMNKYSKTLNSGSVVEASLIDVDKLDITTLPKKTRDEIPTLNKFGFVKSHIDEYTEGFIADAIKSSDYPVLEIGCGYGYAVHQVLKSGGCIVANDIEKKHLEILLKSTPKEQLEKLNLYLGKFPEEVVFDEKRFSAILASRVLHFLNGNTIEVCFDKIYKWLKPEGKFYFTAVSVYHETFQAGFAPIYKENKKKKIKWPGEIQNQHIFYPEYSHDVPAFVHAFDVEVLAKILPQHGFEIEKIGLFNYPEDTTAGDHGHIGFVARKI